MYLAVRGGVMLSVVTMKYLHILHFTKEKIVFTSLGKRQASDFFYILEWLYLLKDERL